MDVEEVLQHQFHHGHRTEIEAAKLKLRSLAFTDLIVEHACLHAAYSLTKFKNENERESTDTLNKFSENKGSPPASNLDPPVLRSRARIELLSLSAIYTTFKSIHHKPD